MWGYLYSMCVCIILCQNINISCMLLRYHRAGREWPPIEKYLVSLQSEKYLFTFHILENVHVYDFLNNCFWRHLLIRRFMLNVFYWNSHEFILWLQPPPQKHTQNTNVCIFLLHVWKITSCKFYCIVWVASISLSYMKKLFVWNSEGARNCKYALQVAELKSHLKVCECRHCNW